MKYNLKFKKIKVSGLGICAVIFIMSVYSLIFQAILQNGIDILGYLSYLNSPSILLYNLLPILALHVFFFSVTNSARWSFLLTNIPFLAFLLINEFKILFRDEPFKLTDLTLVTETANMLESYTLELTPKIIIMTLIMIVSLIFVFKILNSSKISVLKRIIGIITSVTLATGLYIGIYSNYEIYSQTPILGNQYRESTVYANKGFIFSFLSSFSGVKYDKPDGYSTEKAEEILNSYTPYEDEQLPNVIAIMSEAFFDIQLAENLEFLPGMNPLLKFNEIKKNSMSGNIFVPGFAGGTSQTEFEFLSGANVTLIDPAMPTIHKTHIKSSAYNLASAFKKKDFYTLAIHPGHRWFYNRQNVYKSMEFDDMIFLDDLPRDVEKINFYTSDKVTTDLIIENYRKHLEKNPQKGYFNFNITIQNHGPYKETKPDTLRIKRPDNLTDSQYYILENYLANLYDASELLYDVCEFANTTEAPTVVVFFGDHLPYLDPEYKDYEAIGYSISGQDADTYIRQHSTPYIIWGNDAFKETATHTLKTDGGLISSNFLASKMLEYINADLSSYFMFLKDISKKATVISNDINIINGELTKKAPDSIKEDFNNYRILQYYNLNEYRKPAK